jgi:hypothetical protein
MRFITQNFCIILILIYFILKELNNNLNVILCYILNLCLAAIFKLMKICFENNKKIKKSCRVLKNGLFFEIILGIGVECFFELYIIGYMNMRTL